MQREEGEGRRGRGQVVESQRDKGLVFVHFTPLVQLSLSAMSDPLQPTANTTATPAAAPSLPLRTLSLAPPKHEPSATGPTVCLARQGDYFALVHASLVGKDDFTPPLWAVLSILAQEDPFPGFSVGGKEMFW